MTALEWFVREIAMKNNDINFDFWAAVEQAKEIEKQQIMDACSSTDNTDFWVMYSSYEEYYNKTFKMK